MLKVVQAEFGANEVRAGASVLDELVRDAARQMPAFKYGRSRNVPGRASPGVLNAGA